MKRIIPLIALAIVLASSSAYAADATAALDINSAYVWRGITFNDEMVLQPSMDVTKGGFGFNVWGNYDLMDDDDEYDIDNEQVSEFSEVDLTLSYGFSISKLDVGIGIIEYMFPIAAGSGTREIYLDLGMEIIDGLSVNLTHYQDVDEVESFYTAFAIGYSISVSDALGVDIGASVGYADEDWAEYNSGGTESGFHDYSLSLGVSYAVSEALSVGASISYVDTMNEDVLNEDWVVTNTFGGINVSYAF